MRLLLRACQVMTAITIGFTIWLAAFGNDRALVVVGWALSTYGIIVCALADRPPGDEAPTE